MNEPQRHRGTENEEQDPLSRKIIGAAIEVHRALGPGLPESLYEKALCIELEARGIKYARQVAVFAHYKGQLLGTYYVDLVVEDLIVVEVKSVTPHQETSRPDPQLSFASSQERNHAPSAMKIRVARRREAADGSGTLREKHKDPRFILCVFRGAFLIRSRPAPPVGRATLCRSLCLCVSVSLWS
jgi:GxxExxY protein